MAMVKSAMWPFVVFIGLLVLLGQSTVQTQDGSFPPEMISQEIIFTVNGDGTITAIVSASYDSRSNPDEFIWAFAMPAGPAIEATDRRAIDILESATHKQFIKPENYCDGILAMDDGSYYTSPPVFPDSYEQVIIDTSIAEEAIRQLEDNGYPMTDDARSAIAEYVAVDMNLVVQKYRINEDDYYAAHESGIRTQPMVITYEAEMPVLPLSISAPLADEDISLRIWVFADTPYQPENYAHPHMDYHTFLAGSELGRAPHVNYNSTLAQFRDDYGGLAFVTDFAQSTSALNIEEDDALLRDLVDRFPYVTRLQGRIRPEQMVLDPVFIPAPDAPDVSNVVDLNEYVDPLQYWGCSTRATQQPEVEALIEGFIPEGELYPEGWIMVRDESIGIIDIYSPEPVTRDTLHAFFEGEETPPMFARFGGERTAWSTFSHYADIDQEEIDPYAVDEGRCVMLWTTARIPIYTAFMFAYQMSKSHTVLLTSQEDCEENGERYDALVTYWRTDPYYAHPELRHTLFLGNRPYGGGPGGDPPTFPHYFGFPEGWIEYMSVDGHAIVRPEGMEVDEGAPTIILFDIREFDEDARYVNEEAARELARIYNLPSDVLEDILTIIEESCVPQIPPIEYEYGGRQGYITIEGTYLIETSAPVELFDDYEDLLRTSAESLVASFGCG